MLERRRIDEQRIGSLPIHDAPDVGQVDLLGSAQVMHEGAGGGDCGRALLESEPFESGGPKLIEERSPG